jgi:hypothetical protein
MLPMQFRRTAGERWRTSPRYQARAQSIAEKAMAGRQRSKQPGAAAKPGAKPRPRHLADEPVGGAGSLDAGIKSPVTETGLPVEEQIRKEWDPKKKGGLPTSLKTGVTKTRAA